MIKEMIVGSTALETKIAILEDDQLAELYIERNRKRGILGNIYKGRVTKVLPGMQSAFVNIGLEKDAFLYVSDFIEDSEEFDKVVTEAEEEVVAAVEELESPERPQPRREKRADRQRWRDRRERPEVVRPAISTPPQPNGELPAAVDRWTIAAATELQLSAELGPGVYETSPVPPAMDLPPFVPESSIPAPSQQLAEQEPATGGASDEPQSASEERQSASLKEPDVFPFSVSREEAKPGGLNARRRGPAARRKRYTTARHTRHSEHQSIDDMLREGQEILVQVAKEPIGKKGARVTSHVALPGRYLVYMPTVEHVGVSRKIASESERIRLKDMLLKHRGDFSGGVIVRTVAEERTEDELVADLRYLGKLWEDVRTRSEKVSAPALVHSELNLVQRLLRDQFSFEFAAIRVDEETEYQRIVEFVDKIYPNLLHRVKLFTKDNYIFDEYGITPEIDKLLLPKIWLKSGGYIVINQTEALVSIDVNTGKFVGRGNSLEETITRTNLEAVREIVRQIRLRDLGGIIVVDFIDMDERKNRKRVMEALSAEISRDKAPNKILEFNEFGLVAITRKRVKQSLERTLCQPCPYCTGSGMVKSISTTCYNIYHEIERMKGMLDGQEEIMIRVHPEVARALRESESAVIDEIRQIVRKDVVIKADATLHVEHFNIVA